MSQKRQTHERADIEDDMVFIVQEPHEGVPGDAFWCIFYDFGAPIGTPCGHFWEMFVILFWGSILDRILIEFGVGSAAEAGTLVTLRILRFCAGS